MHIYSNRTIKYSIIYNSPPDPHCLLWVTWHAYIPLFGNQESCTRINSAWNLRIRIKPSWFQDIWNHIDRVACGPLGLSIHQLHYITDACIIIDTCSGILLANAVPFPKGMHAWRLSHALLCRRFLLRLRYITITCCNYKAKTQDNLSQPLQRTMDFNSKKGSSAG